MSDATNHHVWKVIFDPDPCGLVGLTMDNMDVGYMLRFGSFTLGCKVRHRIYGVFTAEIDESPGALRCYKKYARMMLRNGTYLTRCNKHMGIEVIKVR